jgi:hypothetical protein
MASRSRIVAALAAAIAVMAFAAESSLARPDFAAEKFVSKKYGYQIVLPGQYDATYARTTWTGDFPLMDGGEVDVFLDTSRDRFFIVAATRLPAGTTLRQWETSHAEVLEEFPFCETSRASRSTTLGGAAAREFQITCFDHDAIVVVALHRGRGYTFQFVSPKSNSVTSDRRIFDAGRRGFQFTSK